MHICMHTHHTHITYACTHMHTQANHTHLSHTHTHMHKCRQRFFPSLDPEQSSWTIPWKLKQHYCLSALSGSVVSDPLPPRGL